MSLDQSAVHATQDTDLWVEKNGQEQGTFGLTSRISRIGYEFTAPKYKNWPDVSGKIETDFWTTATAQDKSQLRLRHAFFKLDYGNYTWLIGQYWDLTSGQFPYIADFGTLIFGGDMGAFRIPQIRYSRQYKTKTDKTVDVGFAFVRPLHNDYDNDTVNDGAYSGKPDIEARVAWTNKINDDKSFTLGLDGIYGQDKLKDGTYFNKNEKFDVTGGIFELAYKFARSWQFKGEAYKGKNLFGYGSLSKVNTTTGDEMNSFGGWGQILYTTRRKNIWSAGWGQDVVEMADLNTAGDIHKNRRWFTNYTIKLRPDVKLITEVSKLFTMYGFDHTQVHNLRYQTNVTWYF